jgi:uncharacterized surface protein with fasciclin (FAS1) repeats
MYQTSRINPGLPAKGSLYMLTLVLTGMFLLTGMNNANAFYGSYKSNFRDCARTQLVEFDGTITEAAIATPELSTLKDLVVLAGLAGALADEEANLTVFAPLNSAFAALPGYLVSGLTTPDNSGQYPDLTQVLLYHVVPGKVDPRRVFYIRRAETLSGQDLFLNRSRLAPMVNQSIVDCQGVKTRNGTVWLIDSVLQPQFISE